VRFGCSTILIGMLLAVAAGASYVAYEAVTLRPIRYVAVRGDTLNGVAVGHGVGVEDLRAWNWMVEDPIEPNQVVVVWPTGRRPIAEEILDAVSIIRARYVDKVMPPALQGTLAAVTWRQDGVQVGGENADQTLVMPEPQKCLERRFIEPIRPGQPPRDRAGLTNDEINGAMHAFLPRAVRCTGEARNKGVIRLDMKVGCDGRVASVKEAGDSGYPKPMVACVVDVVKHAPFPAHDAHEGIRFDYLVNVTP
jgi:LysM repeat protein